MKNSNCIALFWIVSSVWNLHGMQKEVVSTELAKAAVQTAVDAVVTVQHNSSKCNLAYTYLEQSYDLLASRASRWEYAKKDGKLCFVIKPEESPNPKDDVRLWQTLSVHALIFKQQIDSLHSSVAPDDLREKSAYLCARTALGLSKELFRTLQLSANLRIAVQAEQVTKILGQRTEYQELREAAIAHKITLVDAIYGQALEAGIARKREFLLEGLPELNN